MPALTADESMFPPALTPARIAWTGDWPVSLDSKTPPPCVPETSTTARRAFIDQNHLQARFSALHAADCFVVSEARFGAGINFLATWQTWLAAEPAEGSTLHFISVEPTPLTQADLRRACNLYPEFSALAEQLLDNYPALTSGLHRILFEAGRIRLSLFFGTSLQAWQEMSFTADAWFLDAPATAVDTELWSTPALQSLASHSGTGTSLVCYEGTETVVQALAKAGFDLYNAPAGKGRDDIVFGTFRQAAGAQRATGMADQGDKSKTVIIGAGIAGSLLARNLAERGRSVTVLDAGPAPASGASGNSQGALYVKLGVDFNHQSQLALSALLYSQRFYPHCCADQWHQTGLLQMTWSDQELDRQQRFWARNTYPRQVVRPVDKAEASGLTGTDLPAGGLWYPHCGWLEPDNLCRHLLNHPRIQARFDFRVTRFVPRHGRWFVSGSHSASETCDRLVFCAGHETPELIAAFGEFRLKPIRGQVTSLPETSIKQPKAVICGSRYLNPAYRGQCLTGATFDLHDSSPQVSSYSHLENLNQLENNVPGIWTDQKPSTTDIEGRVAFRCTTHDYQPVVGQLTDTNGQGLEGLFLFTGLGSKGLAYAPLLAEFLADRLTGQPQALPNSLAQRVAPHRCHRATRKDIA
jgi:tRNA 5-methylaminomethyl-2-thiouridine biosynthesis bifunctional protein